MKEYKEQGRMDRHTKGFMEGMQYADQGGTEHVKRKAEKFDIAISKEVAMELIRPAYYHGYGCLKDAAGMEIMCKEYGQDEDWVGVEPDDYEQIKNDDQYKTFEIWIK